jgi:NAD(P) transhydrogenase subunit alpha
VTLVGETNLPAPVAADASALYARNVLDFLKLIVTKEGALAIPTDDDIVKACLMCATDKCCGAEPWTSSHPPSST